MKMSDSFVNVYAALTVAQGAFEAAIKDSENPAYRHNYADLAAHVEAARPHLAKNGLGVLQDVVVEGDNVAVTTRIIHASAEWIEFGPLVIPCNKFDAQGIGSAISYGRRYALSAALCTIADDDDANNAVKTTPERRQEPEPAAPETVVDTTTGEEVAVAEKGLPRAPAGYFYVTGYKKDGLFHEARLLDFDAQGGSMKVSTKTKTGEALEQAQLAGLPVKVELQHKANTKGEAYLNKITVWKPKAAPTAPAEPEVMVPVDDIPF